MSDKMKKVADFGLYVSRPFQNPQPSRPPTIRISKSNQILSTKNELIEKLEQLENMIDRLHSGNVAHIKGNLKQAVWSIKKEITGE
jgi:tetrahydrodipicolinate N-succinyltransferase